VVNAAIQTWGEGQYFTPPAGHKAVHEAGILKLDILKAQQQLNWRPVFGAAEAIEKSVLWYKHFTGSNALDLMQKDIAHYEQKLIAAQPS
jgi:CDP-glucose 4,6-dehydratase